MTPPQFCESNTHTCAFCWVTICFVSHPARDGRCPQHVYIPRMELCLCDDHPLLMDSRAIVVSATSVVEKALQLFPLTKCETVNRAIPFDISALCSVLNSITSEFAEPDIVRSSCSSPNGYDEQHWNNAMMLMDDCKATLTRLQGLLQSIDLPRKQWSWLPKKSQTSASNIQTISLLRQQIVLYTTAMQISLQLKSM